MILCCGNQDISTLYQYNDARVVRNTTIAGIQTPELASLHRGVANRISDANEPWKPLLRVVRLAKFVTHPSAHFHHLGKVMDIQQDIDSKSSFDLGLLD